MKAKGAAHIMAKFGDLNKKIYLYGTSNNKNVRYEEEDVINVKA